MRANVDRSKLDEHEVQVLDDIAEYGWHVVGIAADEKYPAWAFTIGLYETFGHPEVLMKGLKVDTLMAMVNAVGEGVKGGSVYETGHLYHDLVAEDLDCSFQVVGEELYADYVGTAMWFYNHERFPLMQCFWPDKSNRLPGDDGYPQSWSYLQQMLPIEEADPPEPSKTGTGPHKDLTWPFDDPPNVAVFTTASIVRDEKPILLVTHDADDGSWQFHGGEDVDAETPMLVSLYSMVMRDPSIAALADLPLGWKAWRNDAGSPWRLVKS